MGNALAMLLVSDFHTGLLPLTMLFMVGTIVIVGGVHLAMQWARRQGPHGVRLLWTRIVLMLLVLVAAGAFAGPRLFPREPKVVRAGDLIKLVSVDMWVDSISMFEDKVRIRFKYRNLSDDPVDAFNVHFVLKDRKGAEIIDQDLCLDSHMEGGETQSWTEVYWATCPQDFTAAEWRALTHRDIDDFEVTWVPHGLAFADSRVVL